MDSWQEIENKSIKENIPARIMVEVTYQCNFNCVYCYLGQKRTHNDFLSREQCKALFKELRESGTLVVTFTGGEPFLHKDIIPIMQDARNERFAVRLFTNGSLIGPEEADALAEIKPLSVDVSLYGVSEHVYETITGKKEHLKMTLDGLQNLKSRNIETVIKIIANRENIEELESMEQMADDLGCSRVITPLLTPEDCGGSSPCSYMLDREGLEAYFSAHSSESKQVERDDDEIICTSGRNTCVISPKGDVYPCIQIREPIGNIFESSFSSIWKDDPAPLLQEIRGLGFADFTECYTCQYADHCFFCPGLALLESGSLTGKNLTACRFTDIKNRIYKNTD